VQQAADRFLSALEHQDAKAALADSSDAARKRQALDPLQRSLTEALANGQNLVAFSFTGQPVPVGGSSSRLTLRVHLQYSRSTHEGELVVVHEQGEWRVDS